MFQQLVVLSFARKISCWSLVQLQSYNNLPVVISKLEDPKTTIVDAYEIIEFIDTLNDDDHVKLYLKQPLEKGCDLLDIVEFRSSLC